MLENQAGLKPRVDKPSNFHYVKCALHGWRVEIIYFYFDIFVDIVVHGLILHSF